MNASAKSVRSLPSMPALAVVIPAYNEAATLAAVVAQVQATRLADEIVIVDDGSWDGTRAEIERLCTESAGCIRGVFHPENRGKGAAIRSALAEVRAGIVLVQDADLEYSPEDFGALLAPFADTSVLAVYGSRNLRRNPRSSWEFYWGGRLLSWITNLLYRSRITDEATGYKAVRTALLRELKLKADGFEFCPELTARLLKRGVTIHEVPISYRPRSRAEGKKIRASHGLTAIWTLVRERFSRD